MKKFPDKIGMVGQGHKRVLNEEQVAWMRKWYPVIESQRIAKAMGCSLSTMYQFARELHLEKSEKGLKAIRKRRDKAAARTNEKNGCYDRKRGHPCSDATMVGVAKRWEEERMGLRENAQKRMKRENPEKYNEWIRKRSEERKESIRKEKMRLMYGLPRKTTLKTVVLCPFKKSQTHHRCNALKRGYILTEDCSEGNPDRYTIYFDKNTNRSEKFEKNCILDGFRICEWM